MTDYMGYPDASNPNPLDSTKNPSPKAHQEVKPIPGQRSRTMFSATAQSVLDSAVTNK
jgi:hypothetical protein